MKFKFIILFLLICHLLSAQNRRERWEAALPHRGVSVQFAGSVGFLSAGVFRRTKDKKIELSAKYGFTPAHYGGVLHSASLKFTYIPFRLKAGDHFSLEPIQCGAFVAQHFGKNVHVFWPLKYPRGYYWWPYGLRQHIFLSVQGNYSLKSGGLEKISAYFEANTNDLYLYSYFPNRGAITFYDIIYFGIGTKVTFR